MSASKVTCYVDSPSNRWQLQQERNFIIEDIEEYLSTKESYLIENVMYQKLSLSMEIKLAFNQLYQHPAYNSAIRYVKIEDDNFSFPYYYYVEDCNWISEEGVKLILKLDTLNTFKYADVEKGYEVSKETHITRQHKDRIRSNSYTYNYKTSATLTLDTSSISGGMESTLVSYYGDTFDLDVTYPITAFSNDYQSQAIKEGSFHVVAKRTSDSSAIKVNNITYSTGSATGTSPDNPNGTYSFTRISVDAWSTIWALSGTVTSDVEQFGNTYSATVIVKFNSNQSISSDLIDKMLSSYPTIRIDTGSGTTSYTFYVRSTMKRSYDTYGTTTYTFTLSTAVINLSFPTEVPDFSRVGITYTIEGNSQTQYFTDYSVNLGDNVTQEIFYYERIVDWFPEEINPPLYKRAEEDVIDKNNNETWYLILRNQTDTASTTNQPIILDLCADDPLPYIYYEGGTATYRWQIDPIWMSLVIGADTLIIGSNSFSKSYRTFLESITNSSGTAVIKNVISNYDSYGIVNVWLKATYTSSSIIILDLILGYTKGTGGFITSSFSSSYFVVPDNSTIPVSTAESTFNKWEQILAMSDYPSNIMRGVIWTDYPSRSIVESSSEEVKYKYLSSIYDLDRTNTQLVKVIALPYCFMGNIYVNGELSFPFNTSIDADFQDLTLIEITNSTELINNITSTISNPLLDFIADFNEDFTLDKEFDVDSDLSNALESKLLHSEFYYQKAVYDSFSFVFALENISVPNYADMDQFLSFTFVMSGTSNSTFMFVFDIDWKQVEEDYSNLMVVDRNNEVPLYSSDYITYMNTGYNYDVKNKNLRTTQNWIQSVLSWFSPTSWMGMGNTIRSAGNVASGITSNLIGTTIMENNIQKKIIQSQYQPTSVYGSDDVDLMSYYTHGRMKLVKYSVTEEWRKIVLALFHYTGYKCNEYGVPVTNTRCRFNFIQAEIIFDSVLNFSREMKDDIINKWKQGVYFIHHFNNEWDITLKYENYEVSLLGE